MPRYFIDTFDGTATIDEEGHDLPSEAAARILVHRSLVAIAAEMAVKQRSADLQAEVRDDSGRRIMTATVSLAVDFDDAVDTPSAA